jgi:hypothetical protein
MVHILQSRNCRGHMVVHTLFVITKTCLISSEICTDRGETVLINTSEKE